MFLQDCGPQSGKAEQMTDETWWKNLSLLKANGVEAPLPFKIAVLSRHVRSMPRKSEADVAEVLSKLDPFRQYESEYDLLGPELAACELSEVERRKFAMKALILDNLVPVVMASEKKDHTILRYVSEQLYQFATGSLDSQSLILKQTALELRDMAGCMMGLICPDDDGFYLPYVEAVMRGQSVKDGCKYILRNSVTQVAWLRQASKEYLEVASASTSLQPEMKQAMASLQDDTSGHDPKCWQQIIDMLPGWRDALRAGATRSIEEKLLANMIAVANQGMTAQDVPITTLEAVQSSLEAVLRLPALRGVDDNGFETLLQRVKTFIAKHMLDERKTELSETLKLMSEKPEENILKKENLDKVAACMEHLSSDDYLMDLVVECWWKVAQALAASITSFQGTEEETRAEEVGEAWLSKVKDFFPSSGEMISGLSVLDKHSELARFLREAKSLGLEEFCAKSREGGSKEVSRLLLFAKDLPPGKHIFSKVSGPAGELAGHFRGLRVECGKTVISLQEISSQQMSASLAKMCRQVQEHVGGCEKGKSWKAPLAAHGEHPTWAQVVKASTPLLQGQVAPTLTQNFCKLMEDCWHVMSQENPPTKDQAR